jgi:diadenosine tetraphosphate (Ap4A) HIT family hydrolase
VAEQWPRDWDALVDGSACPMCLQNRNEDPYEFFRIARSRLADAYLNSRGIQRGYAIVIWRGPHVVEPMDLPGHEAAEYWDDVLHVAQALRAHYQPLKLNYMTLGNSVPHLHTHLVPRFVADPNPGGPFPFPEREPDPFPPDELEADVASLRALLLN